MTLVGKNKEDKRKPTFGKAVMGVSSKTRKDIVPPNEDIKTQVEEIDIILANHLVRGDTVRTKQEILKLINEARDKAYEQGYKDANSQY